MTRDTQEALERVVANPFESQSVDLKGAEEWDSIKYKLARCSLGLANLPDDGLIVIGIVDLADGKFHRQGLSATQATSFHPDTVCDFLASYMTPAVDLEPGEFNHDGLTYFGIRIGYHGHRPVVASKSYSGVGQDSIEKGAIYYRPIGEKPQTRKAQPVDIEALIREHIEFGVAHEVRQLQRLRIIDAYSPGPSIPPEEPYEVERGEFA